MAFNLQRDAKIYVSEVTTGFTSSNTFEVRPMSGFSFNQTTTTQDISVDEAGAAPSRGSKRFNTQLNPTDIAFSTYIRPYKSGLNHDCPERILWEALVGKDALGVNAVSSITNVLIDFDSSNVHELKKLYIFVDYGNAKYRIDEGVISSADIGFDIQGIAMVAWKGNGKVMKELTSVSASTFPTAGNFSPVPDYADFIKNKLSTISLQGSYNRTQGIQPINFTGTALTSASVVTLTPSTVYTLNVAVDGGVAQTLTHTANGSDTLGSVFTSLNAQLKGATIVATYSGATANFTIYSNKYGTSSSILITDGGGGNGLVLNIENDTTPVASAVIGTAVAGTATSRTYDIPITGGTITFNNNITFLTPEELGVVNKSIGHFTGVRSVSGNLTAYLRSGSNNDASQLIEDLLNATSDTTTSFALTIAVGGATNTPRVEIALPTAHLSIPSIDTQDVISTTIDFAGIPTDLGSTNEATVKYYAS